MNALNVYNVRWIPKQTPAKRLRNKTVPVNLPRAPLQSPLLSLLDLPGKHSLVKQDSTVSIETEQQVVFITKYGHGSEPERERERSDVRRFTLRPRRRENVPTDHDNNLQPQYRQIVVGESRCTETLKIDGSRNLMIMIRCR